MQLTKLVLQFGNHCGGRREFGIWVRYRHAGRTCGDGRAIWLGISREACPKLHRPTIAIACHKHGVPRDVRVARINLWPGHPIVTLAYWEIGYRPADRKIAGIAPPRPAI